MLVKIQETYAIVRANNSKIPASNWSIPASLCKTGGKLRNVKGSPCASCYALRIEKFRTSVSKGWHNNLNKFDRAVENGEGNQWVEAMVLQIRKHAKKSGNPYHRWFVGGDLQSIEMLDHIKTVASRTPEIKHWLPTQERGFVKDSNCTTPGNLVIRVSASMIDGKLPKYHTTSSVNRFKGDYQGSECNAYKQNGECQDCRACWSSEVANISYPLH